MTQATLKIRKVGLRNSLIVEEPIMIFCWLGNDFSVNNKLINLHNNCQWYVLLYCFHSILYIIGEHMGNSKPKNPCEMTGIPLLFIEL